MIKQFVDTWDARKGEIEAKIRFKEPRSYIDIVRYVVDVLGSERGVRLYNLPDPERIHEISDGGYQGTILFVIGAKEFQTRSYWCVKVYYGSCYGCDTLKRIHDDTPGVENRIDDYMTLALHIVQGLKEI